ncbi:MAG: hypothetical protein QOI15_1040 [Pseudonocardiales bacterium]|nr:hypothetical protein [Pseudonocardiales bacterium]
MNRLGNLTTIAGVVALAVTGVVLVQSIPDIKRYLKIRSM